jgi:hypothetical protein
MSATPDGRREPPSTSFCGEARPSGTDSKTARADITSTLDVGDLASVDPELIEAVFDVEERR